MKQDVAAVHCCRDGDTREETAQEHGAAVFEIGGMDGGVQHQKSGVPHGGKTCHDGQRDGGLMIANV